MTQDAKVVAIDSELEMAVRVRRRWSAIIALAAGAVTVVAALMNALLIPRGTPAVVARIDLSDVKQSISSVIADVDRLKSRMDALGNLPKDMKVAMSLTETRTDLAALDKRLAALEGAIVQTPDKVLAVPMLRKDLDSLRDTYKVDFSILREQVSQIYDLSKWFIGLMITMAIGILGLAIGNLFPRRSTTPGAASEANHHRPSQA